MSFPTTPMDSMKRRLLYDAYMSIGDYKSAMAVMSGADMNQPATPAMPQPDNAGMPDPQGGQIEGPPSTAAVVQKQPSKLQSLLPFLISAGIGAAAGGKTGLFEGMGGYGRGQVIAKEQQTREEAVRGSQMNQVLARMQEQQRLANEQRRLEQADLKEVFGEVDKIAKNVDLSKPGAVEGVKQLAHSRATAQSMSMDAHKQIESYVDALGKSYKPEEKYLVGEGGKISPYQEQASADVPGAPDVSLGQMGVQGQPLEAAKAISASVKEKTKPTTHYQEYEIADAKAPGGHRTVAWNPETAQVVEPGTLQAIPNARKWQAPTMAMMQNDPNVIAARHRVAQGLANGDLSSLRYIAGLRNEDRLLIYDEAKQINPKWSLSDTDRKIKMMDWAYNGKGADQLQSYGTFLEHAGALQDAGKKVSLTDRKILNKPWNKIRQEATSNPELAKLVVAVEPVRKEFESFLLNNRALYEDDRKEAMNMISENQPPAVMIAALKQMAHTAKARFNEINGRYKRLMGKDIEDPFTPEAIAALRNLGIDVDGTGAKPVTADELRQEILKQKSPR